MTKTRTTVLGIDPGLQGAICVWPYRKQPVLYGLPKEPQQLFWLLADLIRKEREEDREVEVWVEAQWARPRASASSTWSLLVPYGKLLMAIEAQGIVPKLVAPQTWKKALSVTKEAHETYEQGKARSIALAKRLRPKLSFRRSEKCTTDCDGLAEALLIAHYGRQMMSD